MKYRIFVDNEKKIIKSRDYNEVHRFKDGLTLIWGRTKDEDPECECPAGSTLADIEISSSSKQDVERATEDHMVTDGGCNGSASCKKFCYKESTFGKTVHMSLDMIKKVLDKFTPALSQIAYGICSIDSHPQLFDILEETRRRRITPNLTMNGIGLTDEIASKLSKLCGAIAVSVNPANKQEAYNCIKRLSQDYGMTQINIHAVLSEESAEFTKEICDDMLSDSRLKKCHCVVLLSFKNKANVKSFSPITQKSHGEVINYYLDKEVMVGADSCSGASFKRGIKDRANAKELERCVCNCESLHQSIYVNVFGVVYACSFSEGIDDWQDGISILDCNSIMDIWNSEKVKNWRKRMSERGFECPYYKIGV